jgi:hypothetical protein
MYRMYGMSRAHGCAGAAMYRMYGHPFLLLQNGYFRHPWRSPENCSCVFRISAIHGGHATGTVDCSCINCIHCIPVVLAHDYRDVGGRATQDAKAEAFCRLGAGPKGRNPTPGLRGAF